MKLLVEFRNKESINMDYCDGIILALKDFSVMAKQYYTLEQIAAICNKYPDKDIFISLNKNYFNADIKPLKNILSKIANLNIKGILFYDLAILQLKKELNLKIDLVWNQSHMVNNYKTCNYYYEKGVKYALLGKEITLEEIEEILKKTSIKCMVEVVSKASIAFSKRKLLTNYYKDLKEKKEQELIITEKLNNDTYLVKEEKDGTAFYKNKITNGTNIIKELFTAGCEYIIIKDDLENKNASLELISDTYKYIKGNCQDKNYVSKYKKLGNYTNFFFNKTVYKVKKNG